MRGYARRRGVLAASLLLAGCAGAPFQDAALAGKPVDEFVNDLKDELADVHWRVRTARPACGDGAPREVDLRVGTVTLVLERIAQVGVSGDVKLVALPLGPLALEPQASASVDRRASRTLTMKLEVGGTPLPVDVDQLPASKRPVAQALNAAIDGFMRSSGAEPCVRLTALKLTLVLDVEAKAGGGFRIVVPALRTGADGTNQVVNTLTLEWAHVASNGFL